ncbi:tudor domain-containing 6-like [Saccostrea echinata]|uniref:tudor domain-containing 6-like n=1 Tax=Saccostrea echinata TaxID=191078 RepID=UPI002A7EF132|nr:tudor domain-containing 6-like [Saccostrea echinata]
MASNGDLDSWNPMKDDHLNEEFNKYDRGHGKDMPKRGPDRYGGVSLYVTGIPDEMTEEGLVNLFSKAGTCVEAKKMKSKMEGTGNTYGFVKMATVNECEKAIRKYHEFPIGDCKLRVKFSKTDEDRNRQQKQKQEEEEFLSSLSSNRKSYSRSKASSGSESDGSAHFMSRSGEKIMFGKNKVNESPPTLQEAPVKKPAGDGRPGLLGDYPGALSQVSPMSCARSDVSTPIDPSLFHSPGSSHLDMKFQSMGRRQATSPSQNGVEFQGSAPQDFYEQNQHPGYVGEPNAGMRIVSDGEYRHVQQRMGRDNMRGSPRGHFRGRGNMGGNMGRGNYNKYHDNFPMYGNRGRGMMGPRGRGMNYNRMGPWGYTDNLQGNYQGGYRNQEPFYHGQNVGPSYNMRGFRGGRVRPNRGRGQFTPKPEKRIMDRPCANCKKMGGFQCSRCKTPYCSQQCQADHWPEHSQNCKDIKEQLAEDEVASQFEVTIGEDSVVEEMKSYAKSIIQEQYGSVSGCAKSPQSSQQITPNRQRASQPSPKQSSSFSSIREPKQESSQQVTPNRASRSQPSPKQSDSLYDREPKQQSGVTPVQNASTPSPHVLPQDGQRKSAPSPSNRIVINSLDTGEEYELIVESVEDPSRIVVQILNSEDLQKLAELNAEMKKVLDKDNRTVSDPAVGEFYAGQFTDGSWYRCRVDTHDPDHQVTVTYVDYGNRETITYNKLRNLQPQWCTLPGQAIVCTLDGVVPHMDSKFWSQQAVDKTKELLPPTMECGRMYKVTCTGKDEDLILIKVLDANGQDVSETLIDSGLASKKSQNKQSSGPQFICIDAKEIEDKMEDWISGQKYDVLIAERDSPLDFYVQKVEDLEKSMTPYCAKVNEECMAIQTDHYHPKGVGELVYGLYDSNWYRAEVLSLSNQQAKIYFIDFGNTELVPFSDLKQATSLCKERPPFCVHCQLVEMDPEGAARANELFNELTHKNDPKVLTMIYKGRRRDKAIVDFLTDQEELVSVAISRFLAQAMVSAPVMAEDIKSSTLPGDGTPVTCVIMYITSLFSFYVQSASNNIERIMSEIAEICSRNSVPYTPKVGEMVFGKFSDDGRWYRAKVLGISGDEVVLLYTDFGNVETVTKNAVRRFHPALVNYPHQSIHCKLASVTKSMETPEVLQTFGSLYNCKVHVKLRGPSKVDPLEVDILLEDGSNVNETIVNMFSSQASPAVTSSSPKAKETVLYTKIHFEEAPIPVDGTQVECTMTEFNSFDSFYLQINEVQALENLMTELQNLSKEPTPYQPEVGEDVCALFSVDSKWYRARVVEKMEQDSYIVLFVDYGNKEQVTSNEVRKLKSEYVQLPCLAVHCRLAVRTPLSDDLKSKFAELTVSKILYFQALSENNKLYDIKLYTQDGFCVNDVLVGNSSSRKSAVVEAPQSRPRIPEFDMPVDGGKLPFLVTHVNSVNSFYAHYYTEESCEKFNSLLQKIDTYCVGITEPYLPAVGEQVCCQFFETGQWLRAEVLHIENSSYNVQFVDYGNVHTVQKDQIRKADDSFLYLPKQAIHCKLTSIDNQSSPLILEKFDAAVKNTLSYIKALGKERSVYEVHITTDQEDVVEQLKKLSTSFFPRILPVGSTKEPCIFQEVDSLHSFYLLLVGQSYREELSVLEEKLKNFVEKSSSPYQPVKDEIVLAKFSEDGKWYRAKVLEVLGESAFKVYFIDYGNVDLNTPVDIRQIDPSLLSVPNFTIHCRLADIGEKESEQALHQFINLVANNLLHLQVVRVEVELHEIILFTDGGENVNEHVRQSIALSKLSAGSPQASKGATAAGNSPGIAASGGPSGDGNRGGSPGAGKSVNIRFSDMSKVEPQSEEFQVIITSIDSPEEFFCQIADEEAVGKLATMMQAVMIYCETEPHDPNHKYIVGDMCCAFYSLCESDGGWYRSVITETFPNGTYSLQYVDFGNRAILPANQLRPMKPDFMEPPILAFKCSLHGISAPEGLWSNSASEKLNQFVDHALYARLKDRSGDTFVLWLIRPGQDDYSEDIDVAEYLVSCGVAQSKSSEDDQAAAIQQQIAALQAQLKKLAPKK